MMFNFSIRVSVLGLVVHGCLRRGIHDGGTGVVVGLALRKVIKPGVSLFEVKVSACSFKSTLALFTIPVPTLDSATGDTFRRL